MKFRKKPIIIEAEQWFSNKKIEGVEYEYDTTYDNSYRYFIRTLEGKMNVSPGDWIITGIAGEKYPCKPDIFEKTYERVEDTE